MIVEVEENADCFIPKADLDATTALKIYSVHGKRVEVEFPSPLNNHQYVLRSKGYVGHIPISDDLLVRIRPKVPVSNIFLMLEYAYKLKSFEFLEGITWTESLEDIFERLASILSKRILDRARKGLYQDYVEKEDSLAYVRGRVMALQSFRAAMRGSVKMDCKYEEHTPNLDDNRILAWTLYHLPRFALKREDVRRQVRQAYRVLSRTIEISPMEASSCVGRFYHRLNEDYKPMHALCRFFLEHCGPSIQTGEREFIPFLVNMPNLFESFVSEWLRVNLPRSVRVVPQYRVFPVSTNGTG